MNAELTTRRAFLRHISAPGIVAAASWQGGCAARTAASASVTAAADNTVQTVLGPIDVSRLGFTLTHEHICRYPSKTYGDRASAVAKAVEKLKEARDAGVDTLIDVTTFDVGRDIRFGREVSEQSGMQIVACTGQHMYAPDSYKERSLEEIAERFIREIELGIDDTGIKAGIIKVASGSERLTSAEEKVFKAAARASKATGIPITTHTNSRVRGGDHQADLFEAEGVSPARITLGHSNDTDDVTYLTGLARRGFMLGMDHMFWGMAPGARLSWQARAECIKQLIDAGFANRLLLSNDWVFGDEERDQVNPDGLLYTTRRTTPYLKQLGVDDRHVRTITVDNPQRVFAS